MGYLYGRIIQLTVAGLRIKDLKLAFDIERKPNESVPGGEISIYNLSEFDEDRIHERGGSIQLVAGYPTTFAMLLDGTVEKVHRERMGSDRITRVEVGAQATSAKKLGGVTSRAYQGEESVRTILTEIVTLDLDLAIGPLDAIPASATVENWAWHGPAIAAVRSISRRVGARAFEDDGVIRFNKPGMQQSDAATITLSRDTGLVGVPAITDDGAEAVSLLQPLARVGGIAEVDSEHVKGRWLIKGVRHRGDNWLGSFLTAYSLREMSG